jgi:hypothetical protein
VQKTYFEHSMFFLSALAWFIVRTSTIETFFITIRTLLARAADLTCVLVTAAGDDDSQTRTLTSSTPANLDLIGKGQRYMIYFTRMYLPPTPIPNEPPMVSYQEKLSLYIFGHCVIV